MELRLPTVSPMVSPSLFRRIGVIDQQVHFKEDVKTAL
jgi:hypothetical protein